MALSVQHPPARLFKMGTSTRILCLLILLTLGLLCRGSGASDPGKRQLPNAVVVGAVYCDTCFHREFSKASHFISGAVVAVECGGGEAAVKPSFRKVAKTSKHGVFKVRLPPWIGKHLKSIQACSVRLVSSSEPFCAVAASATSSSLRLGSTQGGLHVFSAGYFTFKPLQQPELCYQEPSPANSPHLGSTKTFAPFPRWPLPTLPQLPPLPPLPPLPTLPLSPSVPSSGTPTQTIPESPPSSTPPAMDQKQDQPTAFIPPSPPVASFGGVPLPSNPFQQPSFLPTNPFIPFQPPPPPPSSFGIPLIRPTPPSSAPPGLPFLPFPFPPSFFPGVPPSFPSRGVGAPP